jgi:hypothetical protein
MASPPAIRGQYYLGAAAGPRVTKPEDLPRRNPNTADLDGDGQDETLTMAGHQVRVASSKGKTLFTYDLPKDQQITQIRIAKMDPGKKGLQVESKGTTAEADTCSPSRTARPRGNCNGVRKPGRRASTTRSSPWGTSTATASWTW